MITVTNELLAGMTSQYNEIFKRVCNGSLDPAAVRRSLQDIIEGRWSQALSSNPPLWWRTTEQQLERARQLWPNAVLPEPPKEFTPRTTSEVLLLHVPDTFNALWDKVVAPTGFTKYAWKGLRADKRNLRLAPSKVEFMAPVWLAFDPERGKGKRPDSFWGQVDIASCEVFSALIQFPGWGLAWFNGASAPHLTGYLLNYDGDWAGIPYLDRMDGVRQLKLSGIRAAHGDPGWASPSVREC